MQPVWGFLFRPAPDALNRPIFNFWHKWIGISAFSLSGKFNKVNLKIREFLIELLIVISSLLGALSYFGWSYARGFISKLDLDWLVLIAWFCWVVILIRILEVTERRTDHKIFSFQVSYNYNLNLI